MPEPQVQGQIQAVSAAKEVIREQDKIMLVLSYLFILALIPLMTVKDSDYVKWHAKQGLVLGVGGGIALAIAGSILTWIPFIGWVFACVLWVAFFVVDVMGMVKALNGERWWIPVVTDLASKL